MVRLTLAVALAILLFAPGLRSEIYSYVLAFDARGSEADASTVPRAYWLNGGTLVTRAVSAGWPRGGVHAGVAAMDAAGRAPGEAGRPRIVFHSDTRGVAIRASVGMAAGAEAPTIVNTIDTVDPGRAVLMRRYQLPGTGELLRMLNDDPAARGEPPALRELRALAIGPVTVTWAELASATGGASLLTRERGTVAAVANRYAQRLRRDARFSAVHVDSGFHDALIFAFREGSQITIYVDGRDAHRQPVALLQLQRSSAG